MKLLSRLICSSAVGFSIFASPVLAGESLKNNSDTGSYFTGSIGGSLVGDIDVEGSSSDIEFDTGLGLDLGWGYDFGTSRAELTWSRGAASGAKWASFASEQDTTINSIVGSYYWDFRNGKQWSPFFGPSIASTSIESGSASQSSFAWGLGFGLSYKTSDNMDVFYKSQILIIPELNDFDGWDYENLNYTNGTIGVRYRF
tara:strand:+ start:295 stop:894 length:600 start_codon:yes stop_codon:yes gene_type:complete